MSNITITPLENAVTITQHDFWSNEGLDYNWYYWGDGDDYTSHEQECLDDLLNHLTQSVKQPKAQTLHRLKNFQITSVEAEILQDKNQLEITLYVESLKTDEEFVDDDVLMELGEQVRKQFDGDEQQRYNEACMEWHFENGVSSEADDCCLQLLRNNLVSPADSEWGLEIRDNPSSAEVTATIKNHFSWTCSDQQNWDELCEYVKERWGFLPKPEWVAHTMPEYKKQKQEA